MKKPEAKGPESKLIVHPFLSAPKTCYQPVTFLFSPSLRERATNLSVSCPFFELCDTTESVQHSPYLINTIFPDPTKFPLSSALEWDSPSSDTARNW